MTKSHMDKIPGYGMELLMIIILKKNKLSLGVNIMTAMYL